MTTSIPNPFNSRIRSLSYEEPPSSHRGFTDSSPSTVSPSCTLYNTLRARVKGFLGSVDVKRLRFGDVAHAFCHAAEKCFKSRLYALLYRILKVSKRPVTFSHVTSTLVTIARGGPTLQKSIIARTFSFSPSKIASTHPSGRFRIHPTILLFFGFLLSAVSKKDALNPSFDKDVGSNLHLLLP